MLLRLWLALLLACGASAGSKGSVLLTGLPLHSHFMPLQALGLQLSQLGYTVTMFSFDELHLQGKPVPVRRFASPNLALASLGSIPEDYSPFRASGAGAAAVHRQMYSRLGMRGSNAEFDVWVLDGEALGGVAAAEDSSAHMVLFSATLASEFVYQSTVFGLKETVAKWPVIVHGSTPRVDPPRLETHGPYPETFRFVGLDNRTAEPLPQDLQAWLEAQPSSVVYVSLGASAPDTPANKIEAIAKALAPLSVVWVLPEMHRHTIKNPPGSFWISDWLPQPDLLAHPKVRAFVSSCGLNSALESVVARVPIVCVPQSSAQFGVAKRLNQQKVSTYIEVSNPELGERVLHLSQTMLKGDQALTDRLTNLSMDLQERGGLAKAAMIVAESLESKSALLFQKSASFQTVNSASL